MYEHLTKCCVLLLVLLSMQRKRENKNERFFFCVMPLSMLPIEICVGGLRPSPRDSEEKCDNFVCVRDEASRPVLLQSILKAIVNAAKSRHMIFVSGGGGYHHKLVVRSKDGGDTAGKPNTFENQHAH
jgi:hypothetical protein